MSERNVVVIKNRSVKPEIYVEIAHLIVDACMSVRDVEINEETMCKLKEMYKFIHNKNGKYEVKIFEDIAMLFGNDYTKSIDAAMKDSDLSILECFICILNYSYIVAHEMGIKIPLDKLESLRSRGVVAFIVNE